MRKIVLAFTFLLTNYVFCQVGINTENPQGIFNVDAGGNNSNTDAPDASEQKDDFIILADGTVGVGTTEPNASAIMELNVSELTSGNKKGFLGPRVALTSHTDTTTITSPAIGLLVYNLGTESTFTYSGYIFWNGTEWRTLSGESLATGTIGAITCNGITLTPSTYTVGVSYEGTMNVPYTGGNGGVYPATSLGPVNGLTATLAAGNFSNGSGNLSYSISGTPEVSSPNTTTFQLNIGGASCDAVIGAGDGIAPGDLVYYSTGAIAASIGGNGVNGTTTENWLSYYQNDLPVIGGKLRIDGYFMTSVTGSGSISFNPRLVNISSSNVRFYFSALTTVNNYNTANIVLAPNTWVNLDNGIYNGYGENDTTTSPTVSTSGSGVNSVGETNTEVVTLDLSLDDKWYRIYYYPIIDNMNTTSTSDDVRKIFLSIQRLY